MKKKLLALAALATVSTAAMAQSSVTVYGFIDLGVFTSSNMGASGQSVTTMDQAGGNWFPSMYGITGTEDLGNGLKASFNLQGSLKASTGENADSGNLFGRYASVSLSGSAGSVELGRQIDLLFMQSFVNGVMPTHANSLAVNGLLAYGGGDQTNTANGNTFTSRINNAITYRTPTVNGVTGAFMYAPGGIAGHQSSGAIYSGLLTGNVSGVALSAGYQTQNDDDGLTRSFTKSLLGAKYSVGAVDLAGQYHTYRSRAVSTTQVNTNAYELGVAYHVSPVLTAGINYDHFSDNANGTKPQIISLKAKYDLSKRTYLYAMGAQYNNAAAQQMFQGYAVNLANVVSSGTFAADKKATNLAVGVVHGF